MKNLNNKGITLVALIITIIIMLILLGVTIDIASDGELIDRAQNAVDKTNDRVKQQEEEANNWITEWDKIEAGQTN